MSRLLLVSAAALTAATVFAQVAAPPLQDAIAWPQPTPSTPLRVNPPTFLWPAHSSGRYELELARDGGFRNAIKVTAGEEFYRPLKALEPGRWHWRVRPAGGEWMPATWFDIPAALPKWDLPPWEEMLARIPAGHPRLFLRPEDLASRRARATGPMKEFIARWSASRERLLGASLEPASRRAQAAPPSGDAKEDALRKQKVKTWSDKAGAQKLMDSVDDFAWLFMLTGEERFAAEARRRVLAAARLDPEKEFTDRSSDFANARIVSQSTIAYDLLYDRFSPAERAAIRAMLVARLAPMIVRLERAPRKLFNPHAWQRTHLEAAMAALALYGEEPRARRWVETALKSFVALYPWFGGPDGGSAEGANYYTCCNMLSSLETRDVFQSAFGVDFAAGNPWYRADPFYLIYALPPGGMRSQSGDVNPNLVGEPPGATHRLAALRMAALFRNGYAADYARRLPVKSTDTRLLDFLWSGGTAVPPVSIETLPPARAFPDIGMAFLHSAIARPEENVRLEFRSSPYGSVGHAHADQNSFSIIAFNAPLIVDSGYYTSAGDRHHAGWTRQTKAHNTLLVDGIGQRRTEGGGLLSYGTLTAFEQTPEWVYVAGSAAAAYPGVKLARFDRHLVWLRGQDVQTYVVIDDLEAADGRPHRFDWLLHAAREMVLDREHRRATLQNGKAEAKVAWIEPAAVTMEQTGKFDPPPENWRPDRDFALKDQWHLAVRTESAGPLRYAVVIQVARPGAPWPAVERVAAGVRVRGWTVSFEGRRAVVRRAQ